MKIDLHVHCRERSGCGRNSEEEQVAAAAAAGLDALAFTDHSTLAPLENLVRLNVRFAPFRVFGGIELNIQNDDWVVLGVQDERLMNERWTYPRLHAFVREAGGWLFLAHPFRYLATIAGDLAACPPDGIELRSCNTPKAAAGRIKGVATRHGLQLLCNSDAHTNRSFGCYHNVIPGEPRTDAEMVAALRRGAACHPAWDPAGETEEPA